MTNKQNYKYHDPVQEHLLQLVLAVLVVLGISWILGVWGE